MLSKEQKFTISGKIRARAAGVPFRGTPGRLNSITDLPGVSVGYSTIIKGGGVLKVGEGPVRTGVTAIIPRVIESSVANGVFAGSFTLNGSGEMSGLPWVEETGRLQGPITLTNTHSVGIVRDTVIKWMNSKTNNEEADGNSFWMPLTGETCDNWLNDMNGFHVKEDHVFHAINNASDGPIEEGSVGGGTGMSCYQYKGGTGTSSRLVEINNKKFTVGALVQANFGLRDCLTIAGVPVGKYLPYEEEESKKGSNFEDERGSIVAIIGTDAPLMPHQLKRLAKRAGLGIALSGGIAANSSGDFFVAFSTANKQAFGNTSGIEKLEFLGEFSTSELFQATIQAVDEGIINALYCNETMIGRDYNRRCALPVKEVTELLKRYNRWNGINNL